MSSEKNSTTIEFFEFFPGYTHIEHFSLCTLVVKDIFVTLDNNDTESLYIGTLNSF